MARIPMRPNPLTVPTRKRNTDGCNRVHHSDSTHRECTSRSRQDRSVSPASRSPARIRQRFIASRDSLPEWQARLIDYDNIVVEPTPRRSRSISSDGTILRTGSTDWSTHEESRSPERSTSPLREGGAGIQYRMPPPFRPSSREPSLSRSQRRLLDSRCKYLYFATNFGYIE